MEARKQFLVSVRKKWTPFFWQFREPSSQHIPPTWKKQLKQNTPTYPVIFRDYMNSRSGNQKKQSSLLQGSCQQKTGLGYVSNVAVVQMLDLSRHLWSPGESGQVQLQGACLMSTDFSKMGKKNEEKSMWQMCLLWRYRVFVVKKKRNFYFLKNMGLEWIW